MTLVGIFGGTFDPIHNAHLRLALEVKQALSFDELRLLPAAIPPHKQSPERDPRTRLAMLERAVQFCPELSIDGRELEREGLSYSIDTIKSLRADLGDQVSLCLVMGADSFYYFDRWHRWQGILAVAHIIVINRPGVTDSFPDVIAELAAKAEISKTELREKPFGGIHCIQLSMLPISSTHIRQLIAQGESPQFLLPDSVWSYIQENDLYR